MRFLQLSIIVLLFIQSPTFFQTKSISVKKTTELVIVDGNLNESIWNLESSVDKIIQGSLNNNVTFSTLWDDTYLYVGVKILENDLFYDSQNAWEDDGVEIYIDANNNKAASYDQFDRQFTKVFKKSSIYEQHGYTNGILHEYFELNSQTGYTIEIAIPWNNLGITPAVDMTIGFDIANNDDDNGGNRDSQLMWNGDGNNWNNTSKFGEVTLSSETVGGENTKELITRENIKLYYSQEQISSADSLADVLQNKIDYFKRYSSNAFYSNEDIIYNFTLCKDLTEFNIYKPVNHPEFDASYIANGMIYIIEPTTATQKNYFTDLSKVGLYSLGKAVIRAEYNNNSIKEWAEYGFAAVTAGTLPSPEHIKSEVQNLGRKPTVQELNNWEFISAFDKYAFAATVFDFIFKKFSYDNLKYNLQFSNNTVYYYFWSIKDENTFQNIWYKNLDLFYLNTDNLIKFQKESEHFSFWCVDADLQNLALFEEEMEKTYERYAANFNMQLKQKTNFIIYPSLCDYHNSVGVDYCNPNSIGGGIGIDGFQVVTPRDLNRPLSSVFTLAKHEFAHVFQFNIRPNFMPPWLTEGFAMFLQEDEFNNITRDNLRSQLISEFSRMLAQTGEYPTLNKLNDYNLITQYDLDYYLLGQAMVDFIVTKRGYDKLKLFIESNGVDYTKLAYSGQNEFQEDWFQYYNLDWKRPMKELSVKKTLYPVNVDGNLDEPVWNLDNQMDREYGINWGASENDAIFNLLWDNYYLYAAVKVTDNSLNSDGNYNQDDAILIYLDPNNDKSSQFQSSDRMFVKVWNKSNLIEKNDNTSGVLHSLKSVQGGYVVEIAIPWNNLGITPQTDISLGFDIANIDDDWSGNAEAYNVWSGDLYNESLPLNYGVIYLSTETVNEPALLSLLSPNGNEVFFIGDEIDITWSAKVVQYVKIEYTIDGTNYFVIKDSVDASLGKYTWTINSEISDKYKIRISDSFDNSVIDISNNFFSVKATPELTLIYPNGGESFYQGDEIEISWNSININKINIEYTLDGLQYETISASYDAEQGIYSWKLPEISSDNVRIRIRDIDGRNLIDSSNNSFSILAKPMLQILEPNGGEIWQQGMEQIISWNFVNVDKINILFSPDTSQGNWIMIAENLDAAVARFTWTVPNSISDNCLIRIESVGEGSTYDNSDAYFSISSLTDINDRNFIPTDFTVKQNYPNPFNPSTSIVYGLPVGSYVSLKVYDLIGREVFTQNEGYKSAGFHSIKFDGENLSSGLYIYQILSNDTEGKFNSITRKMMLSK